ncbi:hypothetical protein [Bacillus cereus group sp. BfR-BA-01524]|uniref:hypothetical protein n=1 Tax=Bacillus cereus group sp. BfR-BA-01524 TaxID=2920372 RepID=UPI001F5AA3BB
MNNWLEILGDYNKNEHLETLYENKIGDYLILKDIKNIYNEKWDVGSKYPYVTITHLLDSYYCLPERPDMAFTFLWKAINSVYNKHYLTKAGTGGSIEGKLIDGREGDGQKLNLIIESMSSILDDSITYQGKIFTIRELIDLYVEKIPIKTLRFVANYVLKGLIIDDKLVYNGLSGNQKKSHLSSQYTTFRSSFKDLLSIIDETYGESYRNITFLKSNIHNFQVDVDTLDRDKSRKLVHSLATKLKELLINKKATFKDVKESDLVEEEKYTFNLKDDGLYLKFVFKCILYAIRNTSFHGNVASRYNSKTFNKEAIESSTYVYLIGHLFLTLCLYVNRELSTKELVVNLQNLELFEGHKIL